MWSLFNYMSNVWHYFRCVKPLSRFRGEQEQVGARARGGTHAAGTLVQHWRAPPQKRMLPASTAAPSVSLPPCQVPRRAATLSTHAGRMTQCPTLLRQLDMHQTLRAAPSPRALLMQATNTRRCCPMLRKCTLELMFVDASAPPSSSVWLCCRGPCCCVPLCAAMSSAQ